MKNTTTRSLAAVILMLAAISGAEAQEDPVAAGRALSAPCATCHGSDGMAVMPIYPNLAGQNEAYLVNALESYRAGLRQGPTAGLMTPIAKTLSDEDIAALAAYYASLTPES